VILDARSAALGRVSEVFFLFSSMYDVFLPPKLPFPSSRICIQKIFYQSFPQESPFRSFHFFMFPPSLVPLIHEFPVSQPGICELPFPLFPSFVPRSGSPAFRPLFPVRPGLGPLSELVMPQLPNRNRLKEA